VRLLFWLIGPPAVFVLSLATFANGEPTPQPGSPSPVFGTGPPNYTPLPGVTFPCIPPGPPPHVNLVDPPNGGIDVRTSLSRIIIRVESLPNVSGIVSIRNGESIVQANVRPDATLAASPGAGTSVVVSAPLKTLKPATTYHVTISGWEFATSPCRKFYSADLGSFTTAP
jgi:hypothetical protein